ncbi:NACHT, LRR and PYD domains-containing protein 12-like isoform X2 [Conger conger]|uniref:NACHT, LRR and PYD domains-containing protein 12-like isoform X2 n=1 Tax=Conger conger TaxID=82655 RepID=UPI002A5AB089|nr:NACHT, LRR and PYD domains-containing protein 12-like isoform X2 [Conger conger]
MDHSKQSLTDVGSPPTSITAQSGGSAMDHTQSGGSAMDHSEQSPTDVGSPPTSITAQSGGSAMDHSEQSPTDVGSPPISITAQSGGSAMDHSEQSPTDVGSPPISITAQSGGSAMDHSEQSPTDVGSPPTSITAQSGGSAMDHSEQSPTDVGLPPISITAQSGASAMDHSKQSLTDVGSPPISITAQSGGTAAVPVIHQSTVESVTVNYIFQSDNKSITPGTEQETGLGGTQKDNLQGNLKKETRESIIKDQHNLKEYLKNLFDRIFQSSAEQTLPNEIYTELYITEGGSGGVNNEHEVRQIETASKRQTTQETPILCNDIFKPLPGQKKRIRTVLTKGIAGIGKTVSMQKFILDWAEGKANQDIDFIFPLPFRDLNLEEREFSLVELLQDYFPELTFLNNFSPEEIKMIDHEVKVLFIFDGLDECRLPLNFESNGIWRNVEKPASVQKLLRNLIAGVLLPFALVWITSRPAAASQIPQKYIHRVTEVHGFNDPQKEEYFRKRVSDQNQASRIISHLKSSRSLYIMCHIPVFCCISATVLETMLDETESGDVPKTLTEMYTHFLLIQTCMKHEKYHGSNETNPEKLSDIEIILKLGKLAFQQLKKGNLIFYEKDLRGSGIDVSEASVYSGVCTGIFKFQRGLHKENVYCFVHLTIQEFLAALFVFHSCVNENRNVLRAQFHIGQVQLSELHRMAVDQALDSTDGHLDLFLRFLLGLSLDTVQSLFGEQLTQTGRRHKKSFFQRLWTPTESRSESTQKTVQYIKQKIRKESSAERIINLFHCLNELNDNSLVEEIQNSLRLGKLSDKQLEPHQVSALAFVLLMSEETLDEFDLKTYHKSAAGRQRLIPVVRNCKKAILSACNLTETSCDIVASALQSSNSPLRDLDLSINKLSISAVERLCAGLTSPNCNLQKLALSTCNLTETSCDIVASALQSSNSPLRDLDLSFNKLSISAVERLCAGLTSPNCNLQKLALVWCYLTEGCCDVLASVLHSPHSELRDLQLDFNNLQDSGVRALSAGLENPHCKLQRLGLGHCNLTEGCCDVLASVLHSPHSELRDLQLDFNNLQDSGVRALSAGLEDPHCKLEILGLGRCNLTEGCCDVLASVLRSPHSVLRDLELRGNNLQDSGVRALSAGLEDPHCKLQRLGLSDCRVKRIGCDSLASALRSNPSHLRQLDLEENDLGGSQLRALSAAKPDTLTLLLSDCRVKRIGCESLASALRSNPSHLRQLDLEENDLGGSQLRALSAAKPDTLTLLLSDCRVKRIGCDSLASALRSNPSHLRQLDLEENDLGGSQLRALSAAKPDTLTLLTRTRTRTRTHL